MKERSGRVEARETGSKLPKFAVSARFALAMIALSVLCVSAMAQENTAEDWFNKGQDLFRNGCYEEAVEAYDRAIELEPNNATFYTAKVPSLNMLAFITNSQSKRNESLEAIEKALQIDPKNPSAWELKGSVLSQMKKYNESLETFGKAIGTASSSPEIAAFPWAAEGYVLMQMGSYEEADLLYKKIIGLNLTGEGADSRLAEAWRGRSNALAELGEYNESLQAFDRAIELNSGIAPYAWTGKGDALRAQGRNHEALEAYNRGIDLSPIYSDAWARRGEAQKSMGLVTEASGSFYVARMLGYKE
jgi:tetratricopeptide (TPR) repeat protein